MIQKIRTVCSNSDILAVKKQELHFYHSCCGSNGVTHKPTKLWNDDFGFLVLEDFAEYVIAAVYSLNRVKD